ncbi:hypothetical protein P7E14_14295 [Enterococcus gallinarum]|uniref:hypothetical protein n=1 Tax=Enterococcus gallinarum TaxID=1353 RepID=UPI00289283FB|nr:hypothetical protein [Enterococcus gallinarum]MDT2725001.1 hypothetical protein [Enterococcus gallinarum]
MSNKQKEFAMLYRHNPGSMSTEMLKLFQEILAEDFNDDPELMDSFIQSISNENDGNEVSELELLKQENEEMKQRQEMAEEALLTLSDMLLSR